MMVRTQIQLSEDQANALKRLAAEQGVSMATVIRRALDAAVARERRGALRARAIEALRRGGFRSDRPDIVERHDDYLAEAYLE